jgi:hypothetical protein
VPVPALAVTIGVTDWVNAQTYGTVSNACIQCAIDAAAATNASGVVYIPTGIYWVRAPLVLHSGQQLHLIGDGRENTRLLFKYFATPDSPFVRVLGDDDVVEGISFENTTQADNGFVLVPNNSAHKLSGFTMRDCSLVGMLAGAVTVSDPFTDGIVSDVLIERTLFDGQQNLAMTVTIPREAERWTIRNSNFGGVTPPTIYVNRARAIHLQSTGIDGYGNADANVSLQDASGVDMDMCYFEDHEDTSYPFVGLRGTNSGVTVNACRFSRSTPNGSTWGDLVSADVTSPTFGAYIHNPASYMGSASPPSTPHEIDLLSPSTTAVLIGGAIGNTNVWQPYPRSALGAGAIGFLGNYSGRLRIPALSSTNGLSDKAIGDAAFNTTTNKLQVWSGLGWINY